MRLLNEKATVNRNRGGQLNVEIKLSVEIVSNLDKAGVNGDKHLLQLRYAFALISRLRYLCQESYSNIF